MLLQAKLQTFRNIILHGLLNLSGIQLPPIKTQSIRNGASTKNVKNDRLYLCLRKVRAFSTVSSARVLQDHNR